MVGPRRYTNEFSVYKNGASYGIRDTSLPQVAAVGSCLLRGENPLIFETLAACPARLVQENGDFFVYFVRTFVFLEFSLSFKV